MKKKYRIRPNSIAGFVVRNKKGLTMIAAASIILAGLSAATLAFAAEEPEQPEEEPVAISYATPCEEVNTEPEEPELVSLGEFKITYYCPCEICCGIWSNPENPTTASGARAEAGKTIAVGGWVKTLRSSNVFGFAELNFPNKLYHLYQFFTTVFLCSSYTVCKWDA